MRITLPMIFLLLASWVLTTGAVQKYKFHGIKLKQVTITTPGDLYSTYEFSEADRNAIKVAVREDQSIVDDIGKYHVEENWPEPLNDFNWRIAHGDDIIKLHAYRICFLTESRVLLVVPYSKNKGNKAISFTRDIYFVMNSSAVK